MIDPKQEALAAIIFIGSVITAIFASPYLAVWLSTQGATP